MHAIVILIDIKNAYNYVGLNGVPCFLRGITLVKMFHGISHVCFYQFGFFAMKNITNHSPEK